MRIKGFVKKVDGVYAIFLPAIDGTTQSRTRRQALTMASDYVTGMATLYDDPQFVAKATWTSDTTFVVEVNNPAAVVALVLREQRRKARMTLEEVAHALGVKSVNTYARYERGKSEPSVTKFAQLLAAVGAGDLLTF